MKNKNFLLFTLSTSAILISILVALNFYVDPLARFRVSEKIFYSSERELKPKILKQSNFDGLVIGNSKVTYIPTDSVKEHGTILNAGFSGANTEEIRYFLTELNPQVTWVGLGLDFFMFDSIEEYLETDGQYFIPSIQEKTKYLISTDTLRYSVKTLSKIIRNKPSRYTVFGARNKTGDEAKDRQQNLSLYPKAIAALKKNIRHPFSLSHRRLADLTKIQEWADKNRVQLICWTNPLDPGREALISGLLGDQKEALLKMFRERCKNFIDLTDAYPDRKYFWNEHPVHYYSSTGKFLLKEYIFPALSL